MTRSFLLTTEKTRTARWEPLPGYAIKKRIFFRIFNILIWIIILFYPKFSWILKNDAEKLFDFFAVDTHLGHFISKSIPVNA